MRSLRRHLNLLDFILLGPGMRIVDRDKLRLIQASNPSGNITYSCTLPMMALDRNYDNMRTLEDPCPAPVAFNFDYPY